MSAAATDRFDLLRAAIGLFVVLGVVLTAVAGYAVVSSFHVAVSTRLAASILSGVALVAFAVLLTTWFDTGRGRRV